MDKNNIIIGYDILKNINNIIFEHKLYKKIFIITDSNVFDLYYMEVFNSLSKENCEIFNYVLNPGETSKAYRFIIDICDNLAKNNICRSDVIISLGGGVISDIAGFVACIYKRGIDLINIPTTLLAKIDASIGGKNGINTNYGKNIIGTFFNPKFVLCDINTLKTLDKDNMNDGFAEIIKYAMIKDKDLIDILMKDNYYSNIEEIINRCISIKLEVIKNDPYDKGERMLLNFGHTIGHCIEQISSYKISHGSAISIGMWTITNLSENNGLSEKNTLNVLEECLLKFKLPTKTSFSIEEIMKNVENDKKSVDKKINIIIAKSPGQAQIHNMDIEELKSLM